jgi:hypothetical protein
MKTEFGAILEFIVANICFFNDLQYLTCDSAYNVIHACRQRRGVAVLDQIKMFFLIVNYPLAVLRRSIQKGC